MYCRKSSDAEDRQVQSIPDQIAVLTAVAEKQGLEIVEVLQETGSAKAPGRPIFNEMILRIEKGEADGIYAWKLNRLARNPIDGGKISWYLQRNIIKEIKTYDHAYLPKDNVLGMQVELGMANQYVIDLSEDTKRGIRARENKGLPNGVATIGFLNDLSHEPGDRGWLVDEERFKIVQQLLEIFGTGRYSARQLLRIANDELGLRTPPRRKQGGKQVVLSYLAGTILRNPVYAGFFFTKDGKRHELHPDIPHMISEAQYWNIQRVLGNKGRPRASLNMDLFPYKAFMVCKCSGAITAEKKDQLICPCKYKFVYLKKEVCPRCNTQIDAMEDPTYLHYEYYHCTKKKDPNCKEGSIREEEIDKYLAEYFKNNMTISKDLSDWCIKNINLLDAADKANDFEKKASLDKALTKAENEYKELTLMRARSLLTDEQLEEARAVLEPEIETLKKQLGQLGNTDPSRLTKAYKAFDLAVGIGKVFESHNTDEKKEALTETGSNLTLKDRKLSVYHTDLYAALVNGLKTAKAQNPAFEPENSEADKDKTDVFTSVCPALLRG